MAIYPRADNDSIFAVYAEQFGFVGSAILLCLFMALFVRLRNIMEKAPDNYTRLIVAGVLAWIAAQTLINIGAMIGLLPLKGITLPLISYGGTSIVFVMVAIGLVFNISHYTKARISDDEDEVKGVAMMKILLCGGGTGGHITPILAIARELKNHHPDCRIVYVGDHGSKFADLATKSSDIDEFHTLYAGKFRRYHNQSWLVRVTDVKTIFFNVRDFFYFLIGVIQSTFLIRRLKPNSILIKGGYVGLPVGLAAKFWRVPFITHDSDVIPGLTNKIIGEWARFNTVGVKNGLYPYNSAKVRYVGIPVATDYKYVDDELKKAYRQEIGAPIGSKDTTHNLG